MSKQAEEHLDHTSMHSRHDALHHAACTPYMSQISLNHHSIHNKYIIQSELRNMHIAQVWSRPHNTRLLLTFEASNRKKLFHTGLPCCCVSVLYLDCASFGSEPVYKVATSGREEEGGEAGQAPSGHLYVNAAASLPLI